ncbi:MAG: FprA family A-type flavoprotein [Candidatus Micrarchaeota archaeon]|nr:FprA family A-type flavoprotein [Candidatus Micrarchaeota archaeon]
MAARKLIEGIWEAGARDKERKLFDELIPLPDGTSYNAYLIKGSEKTALIDSVDPTKTDELLENLENLETERIDYIISNHAEQDHSGALPALLERYPEAKIVTNEKCKEFLLSLHPAIGEEQIKTIKNGDTLSLGNRTLQFILTPWVHWPETMLTYLKEDKILFTCDFLGSHFASEELFVENEDEIYEAAKRYYAEIMMPFRPMIKNHLKTLEGLDIAMIAPSHGPVYHEPSFILEAYEDWVSDNAKNVAVIPYVSMHHSTKAITEHLARALEKRGIKAKVFNLTETDIGELAISIVDAATIVFASPTLLVGPHPAIVYAGYLVNALRPKTRFVSIVGSFGWAETESERIKALIPNLKTELIEPVMVRGYPREDDLKRIDELAEKIYLRHKEAGLVKN